MKRSFLPLCCLLFFRLSAQDIKDPSTEKPYRFVVQTGVALQWFDPQLKSFALSVERPLNLYNHFGIQANFFFPNDDDYYYSAITGNTWEAGVFAKCFFHGRLTGRRSNAYIGPDMRFGQRMYLGYGSFGEPTENKVTTFKFMARLGWQYHLGLAVLEIAFPIGFENEDYKSDPASSFNPYYYDSGWFIAAPSLSLGIGF